jgi:succinoglycan biosynthesis protein ExoA
MTFAMNPTASVVIPCRNERDYIERTLRSILAQQPPPGGFEVIVADGMSDDGTRDILARLAAQYPDLRVLDNPRQIVATGLNVAIQAASGSIIIRMDAHTRYASDYISQCVETLRATGADNVGGPWVAEGHGLIGRAIAAAFQSPFSFGGTRGHNPGYDGPVDTVYLGCWPRAVFDRTGLFDDELVRNQDDEFNLRLTRAGGRLWQSPSIKSWYSARASLRDLFRQYVQYGYWKVRVIQKHGKPASLRHLAPATFLTTLLGSTVASVASASITPVPLFLLCGYSVCNIAASVITAARSGWRLVAVLPPVFFCYHFGYGLGFLHGILDFGVFRSRRTANHSGLTRCTKG